MLKIILCALAAYLIGSVNFSILLSRLISGEDIRKSGSGNAGATNMLRKFGAKAAVLTLVLDVLKGVVAVLISRFMSDKQLVPFITGLFVILGHNFPLYFGFKGGKGVATSLGVVLMLDWKVGLIVALCAVLIMAATKYVSLGSIIGGALFIIIEAVKFFLIRNIDVWQLICCVIIGGLLIVRHHQNIKRLLTKTENKLNFSKK